MSLRADTRLDPAQAGRRQAVIARERRQALRVERRLRAARQLRRVC